MIKNPWIQNFGPVLFLAVLLAVAGPVHHASAAFKGAGIRPNKLTKWKRETTPSNNNQSAEPGFALGMFDFTPRSLSGSSVEGSTPEGYLAVRGPVDLRLIGPGKTEFDRSKIIYVEHRGTFPLPPKPQPTADPPTPPVTPTPVPPATPMVSSATTSAPVTADTTDPTLLQRLQNPGAPRSRSANSIVFNNKVDGLAPSGQEFLTPFIVPLNTNPPTLHLRSKATYIRD